jgi:hypothetical protein
MPKNIRYRYYDTFIPNNLILPYSEALSKRNGLTDFLKEITVEFKIINTKSPISIQYVLK